MPRRARRHSRSRRSRLSAPLPDRRLSHTGGVVHPCRWMASPGLDDSALLRRARLDASAFGVFYRRHARAVYRSLLLDCGDPDVALDLTAETFAQALQSLGRFRGPRVSSGRAWIFAIANSMLLQYQRERRVEDRARRRLGILEATRLHDDDDLVVA